MTNCSPDQQGTASPLEMSRFEFDLPPRLIAQEPLADRTGSRLMLLDGVSGRIEHRHFGELPGLLKRDDLLVVNDSRVIHARLEGARRSGGKVEFLLLRKRGDLCWDALIRPAKRLKPGELVTISARQRDAPEAFAVVIERGTEGQAVVELSEQLGHHLEVYGHVPLPPYISHELNDDARYQTVYARELGSAAAPTAGLHFTDALLAELDAQGIRRTAVTLHIGLDTFRPVTAEFAEGHAIHSEWCSVPTSAADAIAQTRAAGGRVIAVGTTCARTLESYGQYQRQGGVGAYAGYTSIYIKPGYVWTVVDAMITNFHLPRSTLLLMISSFAGREHVLEAYQAAIRDEYRFFSFGDAMLIQRPASRRSM